MCYLLQYPCTGVMFLLTLFIERDVYPSNWPIVVLALIGNFSTTLCFAILYMYTGTASSTCTQEFNIIYYYDILKFIMFGYSHKVEN